MQTAKIQDTILTKFTSLFPPVPVSPVVVDSVHDFSVTEQYGGGFDDDDFEHTDPLARLTNPLKLWICTSLLKNEEKILQWKRVGLVEQSCPYMAHNNHNDNEDSRIKEVVAYLLLTTQRMIVFTSKNKNVKTQPQPIQQGAAQLDSASVTGSTANATPSVISSASATFPFVASKYQAPLFLPFDPCEVDYRLINPTQSLSLYRVLTLDDVARIDVSPARQYLTIHCVRTTNERVLADQQRMSYHAHRHVQSNTFQPLDRITSFTILIRDTQGEAIVNDLLQAYYEAMSAEDTNTLSSSVKRTRHRSTTGRLRAVNQSASWTLSNFQQEVMENDDEAKTMSVTEVDFDWLQWFGCGWILRPSADENGDTEKNGTNASKYLNLPRPSTPLHATMRFTTNTPRSTTTSRSLMNTPQSITQSSSSSSPAPSSTSNTLSRLQPECISQLQPVTIVLTPQYLYFAHEDLHHFPPPLIPEERVSPSLRYINEQIWDTISALLIDESKQRKSSWWGRKSDLSVKRDTKGLVVDALPQFERIGNCRISDISRVVLSPGDTEAMIVGCPDRGKMSTRKENMEPVEHDQISDCEWRVVLKSPDMMADLIQSLQKLNSDIQVMHRGDTEEMLDAQIKLGSNEKPVTAESEDVEDSDNNNGG